MPHSLSARELLDRVERLLEEDPRILVPVRRLWLRLRQEYPWTSLPTFSDFLILLQQDARFEYWPLGEDVEFGTEPPSGGQMSLREAAACERGPWVKLRRIPVTEVVLLRILRSQIQELLEILR